MMSESISQCDIRSFYFFFYDRQVKSEMINPVIKRPLTLKTKQHHNLPQPGKEGFWGKGEPVQIDRAQATCRQLAAPPDLCKLAMLGGMGAPKPCKLAVWNSVLPSKQSACTMNTHTCVTASFLWQPVLVTEWHCHWMTLSLHALTSTPAKIN